MLDWSSGGCVARTTANRAGCRGARGVPATLANMARVPIKIPPENSLRAIFFPGLLACSAFPTTHTLHPSHQYARRGYGVEDPPHYRSVLVIVVLPALDSAIFSLRLYLCLYSLLPLFYSLCFPLSLCRIPFPPRGALVFVFIISRQIAFLILFPPFSGFDCNVHPRWCDPPACRAYIAAPRRDGASFAP